MKTRPRLILTSLCLLLAHASPADAQSSRPRFGFGSDTEPTPKVTPKPKAAPQPKAAPKPKTTPKAAAKPAKPVAKTTPKKESAPSKPKAVASTPAKKTSPAKPAAPTPKALATSKKSTAPEKSVAESPKTKPTATPKEGRPAIASQPAPKPPAKSIAAKKESSPSTPASTTKARSASTAIAGDPASHGNRTAPGSGPFIDFFGSIIALPQIPEIKSAPLGPDSSQRPSLAATKLPAANTKQGEPTPPPAIPSPLPASQQTVFVPAIAPKRGTGHTFEPAVSSTESAASTPPPAIRITSDETAKKNTPEMIDVWAEPDPEEIADSPADTNQHIEAAAAPPAGPSREASTPPPSKALASDSANPPEPVPALSTRPNHDSSLPKLKAAEENNPPTVPATATAAATAAAPQPEIAAPAARPVPGISTETSDENDLSEREREFVRRLAAEAAKVTSTTGELNEAYSRDVASAAASLMKKIPSDSLSQARSMAAGIKQTAASALHQELPEESMEAANELLPAAPDKMPDRMPPFEAPASGKVDVHSDRQADYDQVNNKVIFTGKVELNSAAIRLRAERVEVFMKQGGGGMERVEASGNVLMRTQASEHSPGQMASAGRASYNLITGEITLSDWPKIQETGKSHISTDASTKMFLSTDGRLRTSGPNRTILGGN